MNFTYYNPVKIDFGINSIERLPEWIGNRSALLITSDGFEKRGLVASMCIKNPQIKQVIHTIQPNPTLTQLRELYVDIDFSSFEVIIALGGGSVIDMAKALSIYKDDIVDEPFTSIEKMLFNGYESEEILYKPIIAIPTTAGTGSEVTPWGTIWDDVNKKKYSIHSNKLWCEVAICDPRLTLTLPRALTIQTGLDALSHSLESIWNVNKSPVSYSYAKEAIPSIIETLPKLARNLDDLALRSQMMLSALQAGLAFSNTQTAIAHAMSYYMTLHNGIPHGIAASMTLPVIAKVAIVQESLESDLKLCLGNVPVERLEQFLRTLDVSIDFTTYGLTTSDFVAIKESLKETSRSKNSLIDTDMLFELISNEI
ncbi:alcohol dehydrogenase [Sporosarcina sp. P26b]|uniref:phosphonoacetaldehyde reductase n=1 Tax=Sporosarcina sp. P26b TaxID=2048253 RepID=UPI000C169A27|nr:phosphonoacetaldehyde reductase [Sporosarcina sp. P26b]PIC94700.1 alcohol dehydrogenase [Sporosarcina sp. P26b]